jgi:fatty-acyl-CoA synthase
MANPTTQGLDKQAANHSALTPISFLQRSAYIFPDKTAVIDDDMTLTYQTFYQRCLRLAASLRELGVRAGDTVSALCHNTRELLEAHYAVPMLGAVLNALNTRLDAATLRFILTHGQARALIYDTEFEALAGQITQGLEPAPELIAAQRPAAPNRNPRAHGYEQLIAGGAPDFAWAKVSDEWDAISLNYTSGTTGDPKGVVYHHRGAYLAAMSNALAFNMNPDTVYLWTLPMFHCNGWCYTWAITAIGGTHVCLRRVQSGAVHERIREHRVTHMCGAPVVMNLLLNDFAKQGITLDAPVHFAVGGAAPPSAVIRRAREIGFRITHLYGLTESYGPSMLCVRQPEWDDLSDGDLALKMARQGVGNYAIDEVRVANAGGAVPRDGQTMGEILLRGNTLMKGYLKNPGKTAEAFEGGWFHTGDLAVVHPDGYVEIKDRAKDIIISGGENISSQEIEEVLYRHPQILEAAVVACPDEKWGEVPCAFIAFKNPADHPDEQELIAYCKANMASFKAPRKFVAGELPKTATGKIQKNLLRKRLTGNPQ